MPYILQENREQLDQYIDALIVAIKTQSGRAGNLNYSISRLISALYDTRYSEINEAVGVLACVQQEYYRRVAAPYEDQKAFENGDVFPPLQD